MMFAPASLFAMLALAPAVAVRVQMDGVSSRSRQPPASAAPEQQIQKSPAEMLAEEWEIKRHQIAENTRDALQKGFKRSLKQMFASDRPQAAPWVGFSAYEPPTVEQSVAMSKVLFWNVKSNALIAQRAMDPPDSPGWSMIGVGASLVGLWAGSAEGSDIGKEVKTVGKSMDDVPIDLRASLEKFTFAAGDAALKALGEVHSDVSAKMARGDHREVARGDHATWNLINVVQGLQSPNLNNLCGLDGGIT